MLPTKSIGLLLQEKKLKMDFQDGSHEGHLGFSIATVLAISDLQVTPMLPTNFTSIDWLCWGLTTRQPLWVILCRLPEKGRKETEEIAEEMKERDREERGTGMKVKKQKK